MLPIQPLPSLDQFRFTAKIDYLTLQCVSKCQLPPLDGTPKWPRSSPGSLTIHDCTGVDIRKLVSLFPAAQIRELEISIDVRTAPTVRAEEQAQLLHAFKAEYVAKRLKPTFVEGTNSGFRGAYDPTRQKLSPFNRRVPKGKEQQLYGLRPDGAQVKCYYKRTDNRKDLEQKRHCIRTEVRLAMVGLDQHGLSNVADLLFFRFRKELMPYFKHVLSARRRRGRHATSRPLLQVLYAKHDEIDKGYWQQVGVGAFLNGGKRHSPALVFKRDTTINNRIGQALMRLERSVCAEKFVRDTVTD